MRLTSEEEAVIKGIIERARSEVRGDLSSVRAGEDEKKAIVAQNVLAATMAFVFGEFMPYSPQFPFSMAVRLASYALSSGPENAQEFYLGNMQKHFPIEHRRRLAKGIKIEGKWE